MKKLFLGVLAAAACLCGSAATSTVASRDWVQKKLAEAGIRISQATVTHNPNGSVTAVSPYRCAEVPSMVSVKFTALPAVIKPRPVIQVRRNFLMQLLVPTAYADGDNGNAISITVASGSWIDNLGNEHPFDFGPGGLPLTLDDDMPEVPEDTHTCEPDAANDCICKWYGREVTDDDCPEDYKDWTVSEWASAVGNVDAWVDNEDGITEKVTKKGTSYWVTDNQGVEVNLNNMAQSDAWAAALSEGLNTLNERMEECREAWKRSKQCDNGDEQHDWYTENKSCGSNIWKKKTCRRNSGHTEDEGEEKHDLDSRQWTNAGSTHRRTCSCGEKSESGAHIPQQGEKQWNDSHTGWTRTDTCSVCGATTGQINHTCVHDRCKPCSAGDGCDAVCPTCEGHHNLGGRTNSRCARCQCENCGVTERGTGDTYWGTNPHKENHAGWEACTDHPDSDNERSDAGIHCICECGDFNCAMYGNASHSREEIEPPTYEQISGNEQEHWKCAKSSCSQCDDPYGVKEEHDFDTDAPLSYQYKDNENCIRKLKCNSCGYIQTEGEDVSHSCPGEVESYQNVSASVCRQWKTCENCNGSVYDDSNGHIRDITDDCKCVHGCGYQFEHSYAEDECGNRRCLCGKVDGSESHGDWVDNENGTHKCACGRKTAGHTWGNWYETGRSGVIVHWKRECNSCTAYQTKNTEDDDPPEGCIIGNHIALDNACGCQCGYYTPGATVTLTNCGRTVGQASESEDYHHFTETADGLNCTCQCEAKHHFRDGCDCPSVCKFCKSKTRDGVDTYQGVNEQYHTAKDHACGCKCGKLDNGATTVQFHPKCPTTCRCYGEAGDGTGAWHYPCAMASYLCHNICSYQVNGVYHKANTGSSAVYQPQNLTATEEDHTKRDGSCGCKCRKYYSYYQGDSNIGASSPLHTQNGSYCGCYCRKQSEEHRRASTAAGSCHDCYCGDPAHKIHNQNPSGCGCYCGESSKAGHHRQSSTSCVCYCGETKLNHKWVSGSCWCVCGDKHNAVPSRNARYAATRSARASRG